MKLRPKTQTFLGKTRIQTFYCIEIQQGRKWMFLGNEDGIYKFRTKEARDQKMEEIRAALTP